MAVKTGLASALKKKGLSPLESIFTTDYETVIHHISLNAIFNSS